MEVLAYPLFYFWNEHVLLLNRTLTLPDLRCICNSYALEDKFQGKANFKPGRTGGNYHREDFFSVCRVKSPHGRRLTGDFWRFYARSAANR
jgi:hypothetical protein